MLGREQWVMLPGRNERSMSRKKS